MVREINADQFDDVVLKAQKPVLVDFYSNDCPPCAALKPIFHRLAEVYGEYMDFVEIHRQDNKQLALSLNVKSSPTLLFYKDGKEVNDRLNGYISKPMLRKAIEKVTGVSLLDKPPKEIDCDVLILGGGPAGLSAALYAARSGLDTVLVEQDLIGGQAAKTFIIENYPGTDGPIEGKTLTGHMADQARSFGARLEDLKEVLDVNLDPSRRYVRTEDTLYRPKAVVIATGAEPRKLPATGEDVFRGKGIHYCAICDGAMYEGRHVAVIGGGNSALQEALYLSRIAERVTIIHEFDDFQGTKIAQEKVFSTPNIDVIWHSHAIEVLGDGMVNGLKLKNLSNGEITSIPIDGVFVYIGTAPHTDMFKGQIAMDKYGYMLAGEDMKTDVSGVFAAGDVRQKAVRQVATAVGDGAIAAINAERYLNEV
ncbi:MAG: thioredoxin reductase [Clostridiales bacterium]|nr:thioredoxin reductase [Clostridiales bacterium]